MKGEKREGGKRMIIEMMGEGEGTRKERGLRER